MSGIVGIIYLDGRPVDPVDLQKMVDILAHRGPDGADIWYQDSVGLGHRMLWTTPESLSEKLPLVSRSGDLVLTADARIDNRDELIEALGLGDLPAGEITDSDLILTAYQKWGEDCPAKLIGDFAFVIWDEREQQLFCARDHMGVKPFYYYHGTDIFVFASEIKALLCLPGVPRCLNETKIAEFLVRDFSNAKNTFYQNIYRLPAAHHLTVSLRNTRVDRYWSPDLSYQLKLSSNGEYAAAFREVFTKAVNSRLRSAYPVGSTLSGGLDSSSIVCVARDSLIKSGQQKLHTFSAIFPNLPADDRRFIDERPYIDEVTATGNLEAHYAQCDRISPLVDVERVFQHEDEVVFAPNLYIHWSLYKLAQKQGVRVFLDGIDGDAAVSHGLEYFLELARGGNWLTLAKEGSAYARMYGMSRWNVIWNYGFKPLVPNSIERLLPGVFEEKADWKTNGNILNRQLADCVGLDNHLKQLHATGAASVKNSREAHWRDLGSPLYAVAMELADKAAHAFTLEARYPFFDRRLIEFSLSVPASQKLHRGWTRLIMRRAMEGILPKKIQWRPYKANLGSSFKRGLLQHEKQKIASVIFGDVHLIEPYVDIIALRQAYQRYLVDPVSNESDSLNVYSVVILGLWLKHLGIKEQ